MAHLRSSRSGSETDAFAAQFDALKKQIVDAVKTLSAKHDDSVTKMHTLVDEKVAELKVAIEEVVSENVALKGEVVTLKEEVEHVKADLDAQRMKVNALQKDAYSTAFSLKSCNIVIYGIPEDNNERADQVVRAFLSDTIEVPIVDDILFKDVFRMGNPKKRRVHPRPLKVQMVCMPHKRAIMECYLAKRDGFIRDGYRLRDDLPLHARIFRKDAYPSFAKLKDAGYTPSFRLDTVRVKKSGDADNTATIFSDIRDLQDFCDNLAATNE